MMNFNFSPSQSFFQKILVSTGQIVFIFVVIGLVVATASAWSEPVVPSNINLDTFKPIHSFADIQAKNGEPLPNTSLAIYGQEPLVVPLLGTGGGGGGGGGMGSASIFPLLSPFLGLVSAGTFTLTQTSTNSYTFPEALYIEGLKKGNGDVQVENNEFNTIASLAYKAPGYLKADLTDTSLFPSGDTSMNRDVLYLAGGTLSPTSLIPEDNKMVNIKLVNNTSTAQPTNRFGLENQAGTDFTSLRMGSISVDGLYLGGDLGNFINVAAPFDESLSLGIMPAPRNEDGFGGTLAMDLSKYVNPASYTAVYDNLVGPLDPNDPGNPILQSYFTNTNIGYGDYCYLQDIVQAQCPDGFFLSKYDKEREAICRKFSPSANPVAINFNTSCKSTPIVYECSDGIDNTDPEDSLIDYPNDPGCESALDGSEINLPPPPASIPNKYVTMRLDGPYPISVCNLRASGIFPNEKYVTLYNNNPHYNPGTLPFPTTSISSYFQNVSYIGYRMNSGASGGSTTGYVPLIADQVLSNGIYGNGLAGSAPLQKLGQVSNGWYFISEVNPAGDYMLKITGGKLKKIKSC